MKQINHMKQIKNFLLTLCLIMAGAQSAFAYEYVETHETGGMTCYIFYTGKFLGENTYSASLANITSTGDVAIPASFTYYKWIDEKLHTLGTIYVNYVGWWPDQQKAEDITCTANMTSLSFPSNIQIHGHFTLQNLYGSLTFSNSSLGFMATIASDATLDIPHVNVLNCNSLQVDGTILAPALPQLTLQSSTTVNGTITAANATQATIGGTVNASGKVNAPAATQLNISQGAKVFGSIYAMATKVNIASGTQVTGLLYVPVATNIVMDANSFDGTISSNSLTSITLRQTNFGTSGKLQSSNLRDIYIPSKTALPTFYGQYSDHFTAPSGSITVHVYDMTANEIAAMKNSVVWNGFKEIVNHKTNVSYTLINNSMATVSFLGKDGGYDAPTNESQYAQVISGSKTGTVKAERDYSVEIRDIDFDTKTVTLKRNGQSVALKSSVNQGLPVRYYDDLDLQQDVRYEVSVSDLKCDIDFAQQVYTGRIMYQKTLNGSNSTGVISSQTERVTCTRGSRLKLTIPYDPTSYTPNKLYLNGSEVTMTKANGEATATITVPAEASADVLLTWQAPEPIVVVVPDPEEPEQTVTEPAHHQPKITIMRSGEGNILLKGLCNLYDEQQSIDAYEREFGYEAQNGWVVNAVANCTDDVTTVTVPDVDYLGRGGYLDMIDWGFKVDITPVAGQTVKSLMMGWIVTDDDNRQYIEWESFSTTGAYLNDDDGDGTFTFSFAGDEMNWWIGDYIVNIVMGPEETAVETGATLNFVRQGGRTEVLFEKEDVDGTLTNQPIGEGSTVYHLKYFTQAELDDAGMSYYQVLWFHPVDGEIIRVFCDGTDITSQLVYNTETGNARLDLERKNHTYTLLIEDAPDANPTWTIMQGGGMVGSQVVVTRNGEDETTAIDGSAVMLPIDDEGAEKVTLKVPVGTAVPVTKYQIRLESIAYGTGTRVVGYLMASCSMDRPSANALVESLPGLIPTQYDSEADAQPIVDGFAEMGAVAVVVPVATSATQVIPNNTPIRVMRNGQEVTFQMDFSDPQYAAFEVPVTSLTDVMWEVSYDTSHRQTILRKGGTGAVEIGYQYIGEEAITRSADGGMTTIDLPSFHWQRGNFVEFAVEAVEGEKVKICRNGEDVTSVFGEPQSLVGKKWYYISSYSNNTQDELGFQLRDPAVWEITIDDGNSDAVEYMFIGDYDKVYASADYNNDVTYEGSEFTQENVVGYYAGKVVENGTAMGKQGAVEFWLPAGKTFRAFYDGTDMTNQFTDSYNNGHWLFVSEDDWMHQPGHHWTIIAESDLMKYDTNRDGSITIADVTKLVNKILGKE